MTRTLQFTIILAFTAPWEMAILQMEIFSRKILQILNLLIEFQYWPDWLSKPWAFAITYQLFTHYNLPFMESELTGYAVKTFCILYLTCWTNSLILEGAADMIYRPKSPEGYAV